MDVRTLLLQVTMVGAIACSNSSNGQTQPYGDASDGILFETRQFERRVGDCGEDSSRCALFRAEYPLAVSGPATAIKNINDTVVHYVRLSMAVYAMAGEEISPDFQQIADKVLRDYQQFADDIGHQLMPWEVSTTGRVVFQNDKVVSIALENYSFTGGAHPNTFFMGLNFDPRTGKKLEFENCFADRGRLEQLLLAKFRRFHKLSDREDLNEAGFFWDRPFYLPNYFSFQRDGVLFIYNNYEAAPYAVGRTELMVPYAELKGIIHPERSF
jgi:hypothetical protein